MKKQLTKLTLPAAYDVKMSYMNFSNILQHSSAVLTSKYKTLIRRVSKTIATRPPWVIRASGMDGVSSFWFPVFDFSLFVLRLILFAIYRPKLYQKDYVVFVIGSYICMYYNDGL